MMEINIDGQKTNVNLVDDFYKDINRVQESMDNVYNEIQEICDSVHKSVVLGNESIEGELITGTAEVEPRGKDIYDKDLGKQIAFKKAKINALSKKIRFYFKIINKLNRALSIIRYRYYEHVHKYMIYAKELDEVYNEIQEQA